MIEGRGGACTVCVATLDVPPFPAGVPPFPATIAGRFAPPLLVSPLSSVWVEVVLVDPAGVSPAVAEVVLVAPAGVSPAVADVVLVDPADVSPRV